MSEGQEDGIIERVIQLGICGGSYGYYSKFILYRENGAAKEFVREMISSGTVQAIKEESGNLKYDYFIKIDEPDTVLLIDSWESQEAIDTHHKSPMMKKIIELRDKYDLHMRVERYVTDEKGIPSEDVRYIRK